MGDILQNYIRNIEIKKSKSDANSQETFYLNKVWPYGTLLKNK